ncbi:MAG TPA: hypothetical protein VJ914_24450 [Pseudonocardiaceae bacterium]|nr:hypothetical protein [Pseudonocardiaceae bacterium]
MTFPVPPPVEEQRCYWIFLPVAGRSWRLTLGSFRQALLRRNPEEFTRIWDHPGNGPARGVTMSFGITLDGRPVEGITSVRSEGASIKSATAGQATEFAGWLRREIVPPGERIQIGTREGTEAAVADVIVDDVRPEPLLALLLDHVRQVNGPG